MNQLKNGTLLVAIATIVTVILILMTDSNETMPSSKGEVVKEEDVAPQQKTKVAETEEIVTLQVQEIANQTPEQSSEAAQTLIEPVIEKNTATAPEGPFKKTQAGTAEITKATSIDNDIFAKTSTQHDLLNHITQPIWMDQKLGDFKSIENGEVVFKLMPTNPDGLQGDNPKQVVTNKNDKFAPSSIPANYNYQQMPMYNGGYYIAPMPSYLMPSMLPGNATIESDK
ncbi:MAG: hypothetical protein ACI88H_001585 [Cocleimonas sp.]|jgi:hypothetical protein